MEHHVRLESVPDDLVFPPEYAGKIRYEAATKRLIYEGFMSKADYDRLYQIHESWSYRRGLESLFRICTPEQETPGKGLRLSRLFSLFRNARRPVRHG
jgi:hypothetical protein